MKRMAPLAAVLLCLSLTTALPARAHGGASELSAISALPVVVSVAVPAVLLSGAATFTVAAVEASAEGTVWMLERASDGARTSVRFAGSAAGAVSVAAGTAVVVTATAAGCILSAAGTAIAFIPNEVGKALLHNERLTP